MRLLAWNIRQGGGSRLPQIADALSGMRPTSWYCRNTVAARRQCGYSRRSRPSAIGMQRASHRHQAAAAC